MPRPKINFTSAQRRFHPLPLSIKKRVKSRAILKRVKRQFDKAYGLHKTQFRVGDYVQVMAGKDSKDKKQGKIQQIMKPTGFIVVEDVSMRKRLLKRPGKRPEVLERPGKIHISNVMLVDPEDGKPTAVSMKFTEDGDKVRISKRTGAVIPWPEKEEDEVREPNEVTDTEPEIVEAKTFREEELIALKNKYLRIFEMQHYKQLMEAHEAQEKQQQLSQMSNLLFEFDVLSRAKELAQKKLRPRREQV